MGTSQIECDASSEACSMSQLGDHTLIMAVQPSGPSSRVEIAQSSPGL